MTYECEMAEKGKSSGKLTFCSHCGDHVSKRTYYRHKRLYFDTRTQEWSERRVFNPVTTSEVFAIDRRSCSPEICLESGPDVGDYEQLNEGTTDGLFSFYNLAYGQFEVAMDFWNCVCLSTIMLCASIGTTSFSNTCSYSLTCFFPFNIFRT